MEALAVDTVPFRSIPSQQDLLVSRMQTKTEGRQSFLLWSATGTSAFVSRLLTGIIRGIIWSLRQCLTRCLKPLTPQRPQSLKASSFKFHILSRTHSHRLRSRYSMGRTISKQGLPVSGNLFAALGHRYGHLRITSRTSMYMQRNPVFPIPVRRIANVSMPSSNLQIVPSICTSYGRYGRRSLRIFLHGI